MGSMTWYQLMATRTATMAERIGTMNHLIRTDSRTKPTLQTNKSLLFSNVQHKSEIMSSMFGIDPKIYQQHDLARLIIVRQPEGVYAKIPKFSRIIRTESAVRSDLVAKLLSQQATNCDDLVKLPLNILEGSVK